MKDKITILGQEYTIVQDTPKNNPKLEDNYAYVEPYAKKIVVDKTIDVSIGVPSGRPDAIENIDGFINKVYRHEIIHAFFTESGIDYNLSKDEEDFLVDWIAKQFPKMKKIFAELGVED